MASAGTLPAKAPAHIPADLVWDHSFDAFTAELDDPFIAISRLHDGPGIIWATDASYGRPGWVVTRHDLISEVFMDHEHFTAARKGMVADLLGVNVRLNPIEIDPPAHYGYRRILNPFFTPKAINGLDASVRQACQGLIATFQDKGGCEFIDHFAMPFPSYIFLDLMGMPKDMLPQFIDWENGLMRGADPMSRVAAARAIYRYLEEFLDEQRKNPSNDFIQGNRDGAIRGPTAQPPRDDGNALCSIRRGAGHGVQHAGMGDAASRDPSGSAAAPARAIPISCLRPWRSSRERSRSSSRIVKSQRTSPFMACRCAKVKKSTCPLLSQIAIRALFPESACGRY